MALGVWTVPQKSRVIKRQCILSLKCPPLVGELTLTHWFVLNQWVLLETKFGKLTLNLLPAHRRDKAIKESQLCSCLQTHAPIFKAATGTGYTCPWCLVIKTHSENRCSIDIILATQNFKMYYSSTFNTESDLPVKCPFADNRRNVRSNFSKCSPPQQARTAFHSLDTQGIFHLNVNLGTWYTWIWQSCVDGSIQGRQKQT